MKSSSRVTFFKHLELNERNFWMKNFQLLMIFIIRQLSFAGDSLGELA